MRTLAASGLSLVTLVTLALASPDARATPHPTPEQLVEVRGVPGSPPHMPVPDVTPAQATAQLALIAAWDKTMQSLACINPDAGIDGGQEECRFGGIIEVESGPGHDIVESDNTQEAIWNWSYNQKLSADTQFRPQVANAFQYLATHPGWLEWRDGNGTGPDYYSVYNCGWGVRAVIEYELATGDASQHAYGDMCAQHLTDYAKVNTGDPLIIAATTAWGASGLWLWGNANNLPQVKTQAATIGAQVKAWVEADPTRLASRVWAATGGAAFYGVVASYMKENPSELNAWVAQMAPHLGGWIDESMPAVPNDWTDWRNAHNAWNMLGHFTAADVLGPGAGDIDKAAAMDILSRLVAQATNGDGAIAGSQQRPATEAESWITAYLVYFGLREIIDAPEQPDGGMATPDASLSGDGGPVTTRPDAGGGNGAAPGGGSSSSGCGCAEAGVGDESAWALALVPLVALVARKRRTSR